MDVYEAYIALATFYASDVGSVQRALQGQVLLRQTALTSQQSHSATKGPPDIVGGVFHVRTEAQR